MTDLDIVLAILECATVDLDLKLRPDGTTQCLRAVDIGKTGSWYVSTDRDGRIVGYAAGRQWWSAYDDDTETADAEVSPRGLLSGG